MILLKVIYTDGTSGMVKASIIEGLMKSGEIIAFHCSEGWVEVRRRNKNPYNRVDRRRTKPESFYARF